MVYVELAFLSRLYFDDKSETFPFLHECYCSASFLLFFTVAFPNGCTLSRWYLAIMIYC